MRLNENGKLKREQLEINRELAKIAREQLEFDKAEGASEKKFWKMGAGTRVTILVSAAAVIVTLIIGGFTVWASWITKEKEIQVSVIQRKLELEKLDAQKKREWDLSLAQFVLTYQKAIFNGTPEEQRVLAKIIPTIFPEDVSVTLLERLEKTSPPPARAIWTQARVRVETSNVAQIKEPANEEAKLPASNKPSALGLTSSTLPNWVINSETSRYGSLSLDKTNNSIITGDAFRNSLDVPIGSLSSGNPRLSDIVYRPPSTLEIGNSAITKSLSGVLPARLADGPTVLGTIIDASTGAGIPGATIEFQSRLTLSRVQATADDSGKFSITIPSGSYFMLDPLQFKIEGNGYKSATKELSASYSSTTIPITLGSIALEKGAPQ